jgi:SAM-dependent methyltransferase
MSAKILTSAVNGPLWGARARDWADLQEGSARPAFEAVLARTTSAGTRLLDVGCGSGMLAQMAAARGAVVAGVDAAEPLLAVARSRTPAGDFRTGDLQALPFGDGAFDVVVGVNAFQYAAEPAAAVAEAARATRRGGVVAVVVWGDPETMQMAAVIRALGPLLPPPPPGAGGPFALSGKDALLALGEAAGLEVISVFDIAGVAEYADLETAVRGLDSSGVAERARGVAGDAAVSAAHRAALEPFVRADGAVRVTTAFRCLLGGV